ncbi:MAG: hypothetical protein HY869_07670 [Chloroflexi bacterium]|nr:hypothetical protein [Chloroflexota bacterium]
MTSNDKGSKERLDARLVVYGELVFVALPFIIMFLLQIQKNSFGVIWKNPDWSIAATILSGQTLIRFGSGLTKYQGKKNWQKANLWQALIFSFALVCFSNFLVMQLVSDPNVFFVFTQIPLFVLSACMFVVFGSIGQILLDRPKRNRA